MAPLPDYKTTGERNPLPDHLAGFNSNKAMLSSYSEFIQPGAIQCSTQH